jgi:hypothetical protein
MFFSTQEQVAKQFGEFGEIEFGKLKQQTEYSYISFNFRFSRFV